MGCGWVKRRRIEHQRVEDVGSARPGSSEAPWCTAAAPCRRISGRRRRTDAVDGRGFPRMASSDAGAVWWCRVAPGTGHRRLELRGKRNGLGQHLGRKWGGEGRLGGAAWRKRGGGLLGSSAGKGARPVGAGGGLPDVAAREQGRRGGSGRGGHDWAMHEGMGWSRKGGSWAVHEATMLILIYIKIRTEHNWFWSKKTGFLLINFFK
jgi:hypothetical protein